MRALDLFREMDQLHREINGLFNGYESGQLSSSAFEPGPGIRQYPKINIREDAENVYFEALLPGVEPEKIDMNVLGKTLTLVGEHQANAESTAKKRWYRRERESGKFIRCVEIPVDIITDKVKAEFANGLLRVTLPKVAEAKPKKISVKVR